MSNATKQLDKTPTSDNNIDQQNNQSEDSIAIKRTVKNYGKKKNLKIKIPVLPS